MATLFSHLRFPPLKEGPADEVEFERDYMSVLRDDPFIEQFCRGVAAIVVVVTYIVSDSPGGLVLGISTAWLIASGPRFVAYVTLSYDYGGMSLVWLPWREPWVWKFFVLTLPWLPFWLISAIRLLVNRKKTRPDPLPLNRG